jgi:hypothetical protein
LACGPVEKTSVLLGKFVPIFERFDDSRVFSFREIQWLPWLKKWLASVHENPPLRPQR